MLIRPRLRRGMCVGLTLFCVGLAATGQAWWERILWGLYYGTGLAGREGGSHTALPEMVVVIIVIASEKYFRVSAPASAGNCPPHGQIGDWSIVTE